jgi:uncharacterized protein YjdB
VKKRNVIAAVTISAAMIVSQWAGVFAADNAGTGESSEASAQQSAAEMLKGRDYARDQLIVTFDDGTSNARIKSVVNKKDASCETIARVGNGDKAAQVDISNDDSMKQAIAKFQSDSRVKSVQPNYKYETESEDPYLNTGAGTSYQYQLKDTNATAAWSELESGSHGRTLVAVIDTGVDAGHEDLQANMKTDRSGTYVRTLDGKQVTAADDSDETDGHGTHVTGIIGATYNNGKGGSGIASGHNNDLVQVMTVGTSSDGVSMYTFDIVSAIEYSVSKGAGVINMSLGGAGRDRVLEAAVKKAYDAGVVIVAAAGNDGVDAYSDPSDMKEVISVNASNSNDQATYWSDYGLPKDITAPGNNILSSLPGNTYGLMSGTSMASPVVAGIVALVRDAAPSLTPAQIYNIICATTRQNGTFDSKATAYGIIDAAAAVKAAKEASASIDVTALSIKQKTASVYEGDDISLETLVLPATSLKPVTWSSSDESIAKVDSNGYVTGVSAGDAVITAAAGGKTVTCTVTVKAPVKAAAITFKNIPADNELAIGEETAVSATVSPSTSTNSEIYWSSSDRNIAKADEGGYITGVSEGTATITARTYDGKVQNSFQITVKPAVTRVQLTSTPKWIQIGDKVTFTGRLLNSSGTTDVAHNHITWASSYRRIAKVDPDTGVATPLAAGAFYIKAYDSTGSLVAYKRVIVAKKNYSGKDYSLRKTKVKKTSVTLRWNKISIASGYVLQRATAKNGKYKTIKVIRKGSVATYKNSHLKSGKRYYYRVRAVYVKNGVKKSFSYSNRLAVKTRKA